MSDLSNLGEARPEQRLIFWTQDWDKEKFQGHGPQVQDVSLVKYQSRAIKSFSHCEKIVASSLENNGVEIHASMPPGRINPLAQKRVFYEFTEFSNNGKGASLYPPHMKNVNPDRIKPRAVDQDPLLNKKGNKSPDDEEPLLDAEGTAHARNLIGHNLPNRDGPEPWSWFPKFRDHDIMLPQPNMRSIEDFNADLFKNGTDIKEGKNIGMFKDWYSDRRFADQAFTGVDPTTIKRVSDHLLKEFGDAAIRGGYDHWAKELPLIKEELFVTDCSYLREAVGAEPQEELVSVKKDNVTKWANASVTLYRLQGNGQLHPVAIVIDYKGSMRDSVTIFNKAKESLAPKSQDGPVPAQEKDWPWRYAKMCAQASSYVRHEIGTHLTLAHFVEEALIIATNRTIPENHRVYQLLEPHWDKTIAINTAGRAILVPSIIQEIVGLKEEQLHSLIRHEYTNMHYTESYVPNDLRRRGFPDTIEGLKDPRYRDYAYAKGALHMWDTIKCHVESVLRDQYKGDADNSVATDKYIADWCREMQEAAHIPSFPTIKTLSALVDAVTMAIHIAGPFHSAVNYLQNFYLAFVPSRPPALSATLPSTLEELRAYGEADVVQSLPMHQLRHWLLAMQVPWLLSFKVSEKNNIKSCTEDRVKLGPSELLGPNQVLFAAVKSFDQIMKDVNEQMNPGSEPYTVLDPKNMAKSALI